MAGAVLSTHNPQNERKRHLSRQRARRMPKIRRQPRSSSPLPTPTLQLTPPRPLRPAHMRASPPSSPPPRATTKLSRGVAGRPSQRSTAETSRATSTARLLMRRPRRPFISVSTKPTVVLGLLGARDSKMGMEILKPPRDRRGACR